MEQRRYSTKGDYGGKRLRRSGMDAGHCGRSMLVVRTADATFVGLRVGLRNAPHHLD